MCYDLLTKTIDFLRELATVVEDLYDWLCLKCFGSQSPNKEARETCWNIATTLFMCLFDELRAVIVVVEDAFNHPDRANGLYLLGLLQAHRVMLEFVKENFTVHPKFHPQMFMFVLDIMVPRVELEGVSAACANVSTLHVTVQKLASSVDAFDSRLRALEATSGLEVGGGVALLRNARRNQIRRNGANGGKNDNGTVNIP